MPEAILPVCNVNVRLYGQNGIPKENARVTAKLKAFDLYSGYVIPEETTATTDADGLCVLPLWPNELGATESSYEIKILGTNGKRITLTTVVPNLTEAELHNISVLPLFPGKVDGQVPLEAAIEAGTIATQAQLVASAAAVTATEAQAVVQAAEIVVLEAETVAVAASLNADAQATHATTMAGQSAGSAAASQVSRLASEAGASTSTEQAAIATAAASNANVTAVGQNLLGPNTIGVVAAVAPAVAQVAAVDGEVAAVGPIAAQVVIVANNIADINAAVAALPNLTEKVGKTSDTGAAALPAGNNAQRPVTPVVGHTRINTQSAAGLRFMEFWDGVQWVPVGRTNAVSMTVMSPTQFEVDPIPINVKRVEVLLHDIQINSLPHTLSLNVSDSGPLGAGAFYWGRNRVLQTTSNFVGSASGNSASDIENGVIILRSDAPTASGFINGKVTMTRAASPDRWVFEYSLGQSSTAWQFIGAGRFTITGSGVLGRIRLLSSYDVGAGAVEVIYEF